MESGMLWFDNDPSTDITVKLKVAARYFAKKYGVKPNICYINPDVPSSGLTDVDGIHLVTDRSILPHHYWIAVQKLEPTKLPKSRNKPGSLNGPTIF